MQRWLANTACRYAASIGIFVWFRDWNFTRLGRPAMLREVRNTYQAPDEPPRRFFFSHEQDLWVWFGEDGEPVAFQLAYGKYRNEHSIRWKAGRGFSHEQVDDGENAGVIKQSPILIADGAFDAARVVERFLQLAAEIPQGIVDFVAARLREHPEFRDPTSPPSP